MVLDSLIHIVKPTNVHTILKRSEHSNFPGCIHQDGCLRCHLALKGSLKLSRITCLKTSRIRTGSQTAWSGVQAGDVEGKTELGNSSKACRAVRLLKQTFRFFSKPSSTTANTDSTKRITSVRSGVLGPSLL